MVRRVYVGKVRCVRTGDRGVLEVHARAHVGARAHALRNDSTVFPARSPGLSQLPVQRRVTARSAGGGPWAGPERGGDPPPGEGAQGGQARAGVRLIQRAGRDDGFDDGLLVRRRRPFRRGGAEGGADGPRRGPRAHVHREGPHEPRHRARRHAQLPRQIVPEARRGSRGWRVIIEAR